MVEGDGRGLPLGLDDLRSSERSFRGELGGAGQLLSAQRRRSPFHAQQVARRGAHCRLPPASCHAAPRDLRSECRVSWGAVPLRDPRRALLRCTPHSGEVLWSSPVAEVDADEEVLWTCAFRMIGDARRAAHDAIESSVALDPRRRRKPGLLRGETSATVRAVALQHDLCHVTELGLVLRGNVHVDARQAGGRTAVDAEEMRMVGFVLVASLESESPHVVTQIDADDKSCFGQVREAAKDRGGAESATLQLFGHFGMREEKRPPPGH